jgi:hypothetical protein
VDKETFVRAIEAVVTNSSVDGVLESLSHPPGRRPSANSVELSDWFTCLDDSARDRIKQVASLAARQATYSFLLVLDDLLTIESSDQKGRIEIFYRKDGLQTWLNSPNSEPLTSIFKALSK